MILMKEDKMDKIYIALHISYYSEYYTTDIFYDKGAALSFICNEMIVRMKDEEMDLPSSSHNYTYNLIIEEINNKKLEEAINEFNEWSTRQPYKERRSYNMLCRHLMDKKEESIPKMVKSVSVINPADYPNGCSCIKCGNHNQYAIPNQPDKTFLCHACQAMAKLFE